MTKKDLNEAIRRIELIAVLVFCLAGVVLGGGEVGREIVAPIIAYGAAATLLLRPVINRPRADS